MLAAIPVIGAAAAACGILFRSGVAATKTVFFVLALISAASIGVMGVLLIKSMRETIYQYTNIALIGGILFAGVFALLFTVTFLKMPPDRILSPAEFYRAILEFPRQFSYYALFIITAVSALVGVSNLVLIRKEGFCLHNALSIIIAGFYIGGTAIVYLTENLLKRYVFTPEKMAGRPMLAVLGIMLPLFLLLMLCYLECILAGSAILGWKAARQKPVYDKDYIIILGCSIDKRGGLLPLLKGRVNRAIRFAWEQEIATGKAVKYVPSGGQGPNEIMSEGSAMELYLLSRGAERDEVLPEKCSGSTWENMCFSKKIIEEQKPGAKVAFATTNYHILRSGILAREAGLDAEGIAGDTKWYFWPNGFIREFFAILALKRRAHLTVAAVTAVLCAAVGVLGLLV